MWDFENPRFILYLLTSTQAENKVKSGLLLDIVIRESTIILELLACKDEALLVRWYPFLILNLLLHSLNSIRGLNIKRDSLARKSLDENLHPVIHC